MDKLFKWLEKITQRLDKLVIKIFVFDFVLGFVSYFLLYILKSNFSSEHFQITEIILSWAIVIGLLGIPIAVIAKGIVSVKLSFHNLRKCDDKVFENIDCYSVVSQADYISKIGVINYYYQENGEVDRIIDNKEIERLYARRDFLSVRRNLFNDLTTYFYSLVISVIASFFCDLAGLRNSWQAVINIGIIVIAFFIVILLKYVKRGQDGSYAYQVEEFELRLLESKITMLEDRIIISEDEEKVLKTRQLVINALQKYNLKTIPKKTKSAIKKDIETIRDLRLSLNGCTNYELREVVFGGFVGYVAYLKGDNVSDDSVANDDFYKLHRTICKYFLTEKVEQEKKSKMKPNEKHLEFLQNNINRMNQCSFQMKGWAITVASALIALYASSITEANSGNQLYLYSAIASSFLFWYLDSLYLSKERKFVAIYNDVIGVGNSKRQKVEPINEYEIPVNRYKGWKYCIFRAMISPSEIVLYGVIIIGLIAFCCIV